MLSITTSKELDDVFKQFFNDAPSNVHIGLLFILKSPTLIVSVIG